MRTRMGNKKVEKRTKEIEQSLLWGMTYDMRSFIYIYMHVWQIRVRTISIMTHVSSRQQRHLYSIRFILHELLCRKRPIIARTTSAETRIKYAPHTSRTHWSTEEDNVIEGRLASELAGSPSLPSFRSKVRFCDGFSM